MQALKNFLSRLFQTSAQGVKRFPFAFATTLLAVIATSWLIFSQMGDTKIPEAVTLSAWFFALASTTLELGFVMSDRARHFQWIAEAVMLALSVGWYALLRTPYNTYFAAYLFVMFALCFVSFFYVMSHPDRDKIGAHTVKSLVLAGAMCFIITVGLMICVSAVNGLLVKLPHYEEIMQIIAVFGLGFVATNTFLALLPKTDEEIAVPKVVKTLAFYIAFPLFIALVAVLCLYLLKVLVTQKIPSNQINLYVSLTSLVFIFFSFVLCAFRNRVIELFEKYMGYVLLPLIAMQIYVVYIRLNAYGFTPLRWVSLVCIIISIVFVVSTFFKRGAFKRYVILFAALCALVLAYGPFSALDLPARDQQHRLRVMLEQNNMFKEGRIVANPRASSRLQQTITSSYRVAVMGSSIPEWLPKPAQKTGVNRGFLDFPYWGDAQLDKRFRATFGFPLQPETFTNVAFSLNASHEWKTLSIGQFSKMYTVAHYSDGGKEIGKPDTVLIYGTSKVDMRPYLHAISDPEKAEQLRIALPDGAVLYISSVNYEEDDAGKTITLSLEGFVLTP